MDFPKTQKLVTLCLKDNEELLQTGRRPVQLANLTQIFTLLISVVPFLMFSLYFSSQIWMSGTQTTSHWMFNIQQFLFPALFFLPFLLLPPPTSLSLPDSSQCRAFNCINTQSFSSASLLKKLPDNSNYKDSWFVISLCQKYYPQS